MFSRPTKAKRSEVASSKFERAPRAESLPAPKFFFAKASFTQRLPLYGTEPFLDRFWERGQKQFSESKGPPLPGGSNLPHAHPSSFEMRQTCQFRPRGARDGRQSNLARNRGTCRVKVRCIGRCVGCSCGPDSAARLGCRARRWPVC